MPRPDVIGHHAWLTTGVRSSPSARWRPRRRDPEDVARAACGPGVDVLARRPPVVTLQGLTPVQPAGRISEQQRLSGLRRQKSHDSASRPGRGSRPVGAPGRHVCRMQRAPSRAARPARIGCPPGRPTATTCPRSAGTPASCSAATGQGNTTYYGDTVVVYGCVSTSLGGRVSLLTTGTGVQRRPAVVSFDRSGSGIFALRVTVSKDASGGVRIQQNGGGGGADLPWTARGRRRRRLALRPVTRW